MSERRKSKPRRFDPVSVPRACPWDVEIGEERQGKISPQRRQWMDTFYNLGFKQR
jgi:hypothetical protein